LEDIDLVKAMQSRWDPARGPFPGVHYKHDALALRAVQR